MSVSDYGVVRLADYAAPAWQVAAVKLEFDLDIRASRVRARLELRSRTPGPAPLKLDGVGLTLKRIWLNGCELEAGGYTVDHESLTLAQVPDQAVLETEVELDPATNSALSGLYLSGSAEQGFLLTQCEAEGFRRITYYLDRPDVLAPFHVVLRADRARFPVLLANGNPAGSGELPDGRHWSAWDDPHPKPCYLFALVAGRLERIERAYITAENRAVTLRIFAEADSIDRCAYAMDSLVRAMRWDERLYGRNYDLDVYHIVATHDFNMGAMENKGLNIFNAKYLLADPQRSSDDDYAHVEAIVAHEYFHNWTGNRVTCRDWFQLSLKEGLTVYREQQFSADMNSATLKRIEDVQILRRAQFAEDAGPLAHPVRPSEYRAIDNFYTATVYDKGAELVRMIAGRLGPVAWRRGMDEYFHRHDGQAATVEQFLAALGEANGIDLMPYLAWYAQAGTPQLEAQGSYDATQRCYTLRLRQHTATTPQQPHKGAVPIPVRVALLGADGCNLPLREAPGESAQSERVLELVSAEQTFVFADVAAPRAVSLLRGFSAPVQLHSDHNADDLAFLLRNESDGFNRWEASQQLARKALLRAIDGETDSPELRIWCDTLAELFGADIDPALLAELSMPPDYNELAPQCEPLDPAALHAARETLENALARRLAEMLATRHTLLLRSEVGAFDGLARGRRRLLNRCLRLWLRIDSELAPEVAATRYVLAPTMTERLAALAGLLAQDAPQAQKALQDFARRYDADAVTLDKWFALQATVPRPDTVERVAALLHHPRFSLRNPNRVAALLHGFAARNPIAFHRSDGAGYRLIEQALREIDALNPTTAARLATALKDWRRLEPQRRALAQATLQRLSEGESSHDLGDILRRSLG
ncbi:MAG: aminopeptidase N [Rhodanobacteraceae bacterium]|nr:aminopeptidase N [Rhodanobacteraceae bacterium]